MPGESALLVLLLAFLVPVAVYCLILALINRRERPLVVSGVWDGVGLLFASSGFFLVTVPGILGTLYFKGLNALTVEGEAPTGAATLGELLAHQWGILALYYGGVVLLALLVLWARRNKVVVYNVEPEVMERGLERAAARLGLVPRRAGDRLLLTPAPAGENELPTDAGRPPPTFAPAHAAELRLDAFPAMCNVTLHWVAGDERLRADLEGRLAKELKQSRTYDNPAGGWFLGVAGGLFGLTFLVLVLLVLASLLPLRRP